MIKNSAGLEMYGLIKLLFPLYRTLAGPSSRKSLEHFEEIHEEFTRLRFRSGMRVFDWTVPDEWSIRDAYIESAGGKRYGEFKSNNLSVVGYSQSVDRRVDRVELLNHIHTSVLRPEAIPYVTSYYKKDWGFCLTRKEREELTEDEYHVVIDAEHRKGYMEMIEAVFKGSSKKEIFFSSYICHPSMANNELSGPSLVSSLMTYIKSLKKRRYTYRFVILPETIGSIAYLSRRRRWLKQKVLAGFNLTCVGDNNEYSYIMTPSEDTLADKAIESALIGKRNVKRCSFMKRGSDERQYCAPGIELPVVTFCRSKFHDYPEYHTSDDNLDLVSPDGLQGSFDVMTSIVDSLENGLFPMCTTYGEPMLSKRGLYPNISNEDSTSGRHIALRDLLALSNGKRNVFEIAMKIGRSLEEVNQDIKSLKDLGLLTVR